MEWSFKVQGYNGASSHRTPQTWQILIIPGCECHHVVCWRWEWPNDRWPQSKCDSQNGVFYLGCLCTTWESTRKMVSSRHCHFTRLSMWNAATFPWTLTLWERLEGRTDCHRQLSFVAYSLSQHKDEARKFEQQRHQPIKPISGHITSYQTITTSQQEKLLFCYQKGPIQIRATSNRLCSHGRWQQSSRRYLSQDNKGSCTCFEGMNYLLLLSP